MNIKIPSIPKTAYPRVLFWFALSGFTFYILGPILFPDAPIRQPEVLPVYTLMLGLGQLYKGNDEKGDTKENAEANKEGS